MKSVSAGIEVVGRLGEVGAIDVGDEAEGHRAFAVMPQRLVRHYGSQVGAADADVDDVADALSGVALPCAAADAIGEIRHLVEHGMNLRHHVLAVDHDRCPRGARSATCSTARFSVMLIFSPRNIASRARQAAIPGELQQQPNGFIGDAVFGVIEVQASAFSSEALAARRIVREQIAAGGRL